MRLAYTGVGDKYHLTPDKTKSLCGRSVAYTLNTDPKHVTCKQCRRAAKLANVDTAQAWADLRKEESTS